MGNVAVGELCTVHESPFSHVPIGRAQVVALSGDTAVLSLLDAIDGLRREFVVRPSGNRMSIHMSFDMLGTVLNASGRIVERIAGQANDANAGTDAHDHAADADRDMPLDVMGPHYADRNPETSPLWSGIRAIDGLLTCAMGQRVGIFAAAGSGKSSLMSMLIDGVEAHVTIVALIGERGREVSEFVDAARRSRLGERLIIVYATSDQSAVERANAAKVAMAAAEYFRDQGANVTVYLDSLTRYARAERDIALASGELPVKRGYPLSVFDRLPKLIERAGRTVVGSITAFYTVLLESEDEVDLVADEIRSLLDGHIYLSRGLADTHHYPAIDVLKSASRLFDAVTDQKHQTAAAAFRQRLSKYQELQVYIDMGEYKRGLNAENDQIVDCHARMRRFLIQDKSEWSDPSETIQALHEATRNPG
ncbi:FliI/YscN family ATPase [Robbsia sp. Bb-Pol-6]|uniref:FliI/YscN family ATPase n=1 Tax=Robbsia betulipollinis TaxID=2981849 RepID=A0ABT3ZLC5_9BURK|nr:FliI/YscN family ATPase [Robbsia betulipollinis]MCY0387217.1 FliI/YscN family ATPase [Robbsia betulipollinis]